MLFTLGRHIRIFVSSINEPHLSKHPPFRCMEFEYNSARSCLKYLRNVVTYLCYKGQKKIARHPLMLSTDFCDAQGMPAGIVIGILLE